MNISEVEKKLLALGKTPGKIARSLERIGCRGTRSSCYSDPIAVFLTKHIGIKLDVYVMPDLITVWFQSPVDKRYIGPMPEMTKFMQRFDRGLYPFLEVAR